MLHEFKQHWLTWIEDIDRDLYQTLSIKDIHERLRIDQNIRTMRIKQKQGQGLEIDPITWSDVDGQAEGMKLDADAQKRLQQEMREKAVLKRQKRLLEKRLKENRQKVRERWLAAGRKSAWDHLFLILAELTD